MQTVTSLLEALLPVVKENYQPMSALGSTARAQTALQNLRLTHKSVQVTDQLMVSFCKYIVLKNKSMCKNKSDRSPVINF